MTIKVNNTRKQSIEISAENKYQEINVKNISEQKIEIIDRKGSQDIEVENTVEQEVNVEQDIIIVPVYEDAPLYEGEYDATPRFVEQTLPTSHKLLEEDITIKGIPYHEVSNNSGGTTVTIG